MQGLGARKRFQNFCWIQDGLVPKDQNHVQDSKFNSEQNLISKINHCHIWFSIQSHSNRKLGLNLSIANLTAGLNTRKES